MPLTINIAVPTVTNSMNIAAAMVSSSPRTTVKSSVVTPASTVAVPRQIAIVKLFISLSYPAASSVKFSSALPLISSSSVQPK